jgi:parallel beta-helix repeat protein
MNGLISRKFLAAFVSNCKILKKYLKENIMETRTVKTERRQSFRAVLGAALGVLIAIGLAGVARAQTEVYPTGNAADDVSNVQAAVDLGGTVLLKATDASGNPQYFNFGTAGGAYGLYVEVNNDVVIKGEAGSITLPDGRMTDRTAIYGGGAGTQCHEAGNPDLRGAFTAMAGNFEISGLWLDSSVFSGIFVRGCDGAVIRDNVITYTRGVNSTVPGHEWRSWAKPISGPEWPSDQVFGDIIIANNTIEFNPNPPEVIRWAEGISLFTIESNPMPNISIIGNTIVNPGTVHGLHPVWKYRDPKGIHCMQPATIRDNTIRGSWYKAIYSASVVSWPTLASSVIEGNLIEGLVPGEGCKTYNIALHVWRSNNSVLRNNTVRGQSWRGITASQSTGTLIRNNIVSGTHQLGIEAYLAPGTDITANTVSASGRVGIVVDRLSNNTTVKQNTIQNFHCLVDWGAPIIVQSASNCIVTNNTLIDVYYPDNYAQNKGPIAGIRISGYGTWDAPCTNNIILGNDYKKSGLPGWNKKHPAGPGCVLLEADWWGANYGAAIENYVSENHHAYPEGTTICEQILDMTATPENPDGENTEVGMEKCPEVSDYIDRLRDAAEREREEQELLGEEQQLLEVLSLEEEYPLP